MSTLFERDYYEADSFWAGDALTDVGNQARVRLTASIVPRDVGSLLDAGCGNGVFGRALAAVRPDVALVGVDRSAAALKYVDFETTQGCLDSLPFADRSFDCVTCLQVIEHLPVGVYETSLSEIARVARRYAIIGIPYRENLERETTTCPVCRSRFNINLHLRSYDDDAIANLFAAHGGRLTGVEFPARKSRPRFVNEAIALLRREQRLQGFCSPICPICGYSEGDNTPLSIEASLPPRPVDRSAARSRIKSALRPLAKVWPREDVFGYWAIGLYEFEATPSRG